MKILGVEYTYVVADRCVCLAVERMSGLQGLRLRDILPLLQIVFEIEVRD